MTSCRLFYVVGQLGAGGLERQLGYLLKVMDRDALQPKVAVWNYNGQDVNARRLKLLGVELIPIPRYRTRLVRAMWVRRMVAALRPEVVHSYSFYTNLVTHFGAGKAISVGSIRADFIRDRVTTGAVLGRMCARWPRAQVCNSRAALRNIANSGSPFRPRHVFLVRNALDLEQFACRDIPATRPPLVLGLGSLVSFKRWDRLIQVGNALSQRGIQARICIVGDGPDREILQSQISRLGLDETVHLAGYRENVSETLAQATVVVHVSDSEGYPNAVMEAMACGRAVVATNAGDAVDLIKDGQTGFVVPIGDDGALAERVAHLVTNTALARQMGIAGRDRAQAMFGCDRLVSETLGAYRSLGWVE